MPFDPRPLLPVLMLGLATPATAALPPLIPREALFAPADRGDPRISPDGTQMAFAGASKEGIRNLFVRKIGAREDRQVTHDTHRGIYDYAWGPAGKRLLYIQDHDGDENWHLWSTDLTDGATRDLTPFPGVRAANLITDPRHPDAVLVGLNRRDPTVIDMYRVNLATGEVTLEAENPGGVVEWVADEQFHIRACAAIDDEGRAIIRVRDEAGGPWRNLLTWSFEEAGFDRFQRVLGFSPDGRALRVQSCVGSNTTRIVEVDLASGAQHDLIPADPKNDLYNALSISQEFFPVAVMTSPATGAIEAYKVHRMIPEWRVVDPALKKDFQRLHDAGKGEFDIVSRDRDDRRWIVEFYSDLNPGADYVYDRKSGSLELLFEHRPELDRYTFAPMKPVTYKANDGLDISAFLTLPVGVPAKHLPMIVMPHGGPWARDEWGYNAEVQWLANRGYAVLQPEFRGSTGFGNAFVAASTDQMGTGHMQQDVSDGVRWAIAQGIADPKRVGIMGGSYGGYATLSGLAFTPDLYACGVDVVGPSNLRTLIGSFPPYWKPRLKRWISRVGDVMHDDSLNRAISPLFHVDAIRAPLLIGHGANDPRVKIEESKQVVAAMRRHGHDVTFIVYPDEGHGFGRPANIEDFNGRTEEFLAKYLGGRKEPWKKVEGTTAEVR